MLYKYCTRTHSWKPNRPDPYWLGVSNHWRSKLNMSVMNTNLGIMAIL